MLEDQTTYKHYTLGYIEYLLGKKIKLYPEKCGKEKNWGNVWVVAFFKDKNGRIKVATNWRRKSNERSTDKQFFIEDFNFIESKYPVEEYLKQEAMTNILDL